MTADMMYLVHGLMSVVFHDNPAVGDDNQIDQVQALADAAQRVCDLIDAAVDWDQNDKMFVYECFDYETDSYMQGFCYNIVEAQNHDDHKDREMRLVDAFVEHHELPRSPSEYVFADALKQYLDARDELTVLTIMQPEDADNEAEKTKAKNMMLEAEEHMNAWTRSEGK